MESEQKGGNVCSFESRILLSIYPSTLSTDRDPFIAVSAKFISPSRTLVLPPACGENVKYFGLNR